MLQWQKRAFNELKTQELYDILALRESVFIVEQKSIYHDLDYRDQQSLHLLGIENQQLVAYARILPKDLAYPNAVSFGRIVTAASVRGKSFGKALMQQLMQHFTEINNSLPIIISAQQYLEKFYQSYGFNTMSEPYDEDGIPHIKMVKQ